MEVFDPHTGLARARAAHRAGSRVPHTVVVLPSYSMSMSLVAHYGPRIPALEHRQLLALLMLPRVPGSEMVFVVSRQPSERVLEYYLAFLPPEHRRDTRRRIRFVEVPDRTHRSVTAKVLERPDLMATIRAMTRGRLAYIEPWNVTHLEMELADRLGLPLNGTPPSLWSLGFKSNGRRLMRGAGVPLPLGREDVRSVGDVLAAAAAVRREHTHVTGVVIKLDNSGAGHGNRTIRFASCATAAELQRAVEALDPRFLSELAGGAVVEELITGRQLASPSVQVDIAPLHRVEVISTHEQLLGGPSGQVYLGCRFPAEPGYRDQLTVHGETVGKALAEHGAMGRFSVDFVASRASSSRWEVHGLEINLRKGGTSHPLSLLHSLVPGRYDAAAGTWSVGQGAQRCYFSTDNLAAPAWSGRPADDLIDAVRTAGLEFDPGSGTGTGTILHMLVGLDLDGVIGLTTIGRSAGHAEELHQAAVAVIQGPAEPEHGRTSA